MTDPIGNITGLSPLDSQEPVVCSIVSRKAGEQLFATVSTTSIWLLLEYDHPMGVKAFEESAIPQPVKDHLNSFLKSAPGTRLQLIRQGKEEARATLAFYIAIAREENPSLYKFHINDYEELLSFDIPAVVSEAQEVKGYLRQAPLFLVCTNGRRDPCCSRWGLPVYDSLSQYEPASTWQTSHVGGHRFAANVLCFPAGIYYGHVDPSETKNLAIAFQSGQIWLANYRGRACYSPAAQAAEYFLRSQTGEAGVDAFRLDSIRAVSSGTWEVRFVAKAAGHLYQMEIASETSSFQIFESCKSAQPASQTQYRLNKFQKHK